MKLNLFDTHTHLDCMEFDEDRKDVIERVNQNLAGIINPGCDLNTSKIAVKLAEENPCIYAAVGYHPESMSDTLLSEIELIRPFLSHPKVVAVGEIGLDYYWKENASREVQIEGFIRQIELAKEFDLPIIVHDRDAHGDILDLMRSDISKNLRGVFHCYSGSVEMAKELLKKGFYFGFGGTSTFKNAKKVREVLMMMPQDRILFETDAPYMAPVPMRGKRNEPSYTRLVAENAAKVRNEDFDELINASTENTKTLFNKIK